MPMTPPLSPPMPVYLGISQTMRELRLLQPSTGEFSPTFAQVTVRRRSPGHHSESEKWRRPPRPRWVARHQYASVVRIVVIHFQATSSIFEASETCCFLSIKWYHGISKKSKNSAEIKLGFVASLNQLIPSDGFWLKATNQLLTPSRPWHRIPSKPAMLEPLLPVPPGMLQLFKGRLKDVATSMATRPQSKFKKDASWKRKNCSTWRVWNFEDLLFQTSVWSLGN